MTTTPAKASTAVMATTVEPSAAAVGTTPLEASASTSELMHKLKNLVTAIAEENDRQIETFAEAVRVLMALRDGTTPGNLGANEKQRLPLRNPRRYDERIEIKAIPVHFRCPISSELMRNPVILASGQTYDRSFIQQWLNSGNQICPQTKEALPDTTLIPNLLVRRIIFRWCAERGLCLPPIKDDPEDGGLLTLEENKNLLDGLLNKICLHSSPAEQNRAISELRRLTERNRSVRALMGEKPGAFTQLFDVLSSPESVTDPQVQEDAVTIILYTSFHEANKSIIGETPRAIPFLISALESERMETRSRSAAALFSLSALDSNKIKIGEMGAMKPLVELLEQGSSTAKKDAASAIFSLCLTHDNRPRAVSEGVLQVLLKAIADRSLMDESLSILARLSGDQEIAEKIAAIGGVACFLSIVRGDPCAKNKENAVVVLHSICMGDVTKLKEVREENFLNESISRLAQNGTSRARRKAVAMLDKWKLKKGTVDNIVRS